MPARISSKVWAPPREAKVYHSSWRCPSCKVCEICGSNGCDGGDGVPKFHCSQCKRLFHKRCVRKALKFDHQNVLQGMCHNCHIEKRATAIIPAHSSSSSSSTTTTTYSTFLKSQITSMVALIQKQRGTGARVSSRRQSAGRIEVQFGHIILGREVAIANMDKYNGMHGIIVDAPVNLSGVPPENLPVKVRLDNDVVIATSIGNCVVFESKFAGDDAQSSVLSPSKWNARKCEPASPIAHQIADDVVDQRECVLCPYTGDHPCAGPLLPLPGCCGCIHGNCALWSAAQVDVDDRMLMSNVLQSFHIAKEITCTLCKNLEQQLPWFLEVVVFTLPSHHLTTTITPVP